MAGEERNEGDDAPDGSPLPKWVRILVAVLTPLAPVLVVCVDAYAR
ncbi:hypothetical protein ACFRMN_16520 [Streptomyces sp. NPDC056835]